jgi:hypothetical protein
MLACHVRKATRLLLMHAFVVAVLVMPVEMSGGPAPQKTAAKKPPALRFEITFPSAAHATPVTGRVYVMIARAGDREPRLQIGRTGQPFFGRDVEKLAPGTPAIIDDTDLGTPVDSLRDIPAGDSSSRRW